MRRPRNAMSTIRLSILIATALFAGSLTLASTTLAQNAPEGTQEPLTLTLDEALQIALVHNYAMRFERLNVEQASAQVREAWGEVWPLIDVTSSYTRNLKSANPFAGSEAGGLFGSLGFVDWLSFNERARTDTDTETAPIDFDDYTDRLESGLDAIGASFGGDANPFAVPNEFLNSISLSQTIFSAEAFVGIQGASYYQDLTGEALNRQRQLVLHEVRQAFYQALLSLKQVEIVRMSVARTQITLDETIRRVSQGLAPKFQRLTAEVELANLETQQVEAAGFAAQALDNLKMQIGIPVDQPIRLRGNLETEERGRFLTVAAENAIDMALAHRPDLEQARLAIELQRVDRRLAMTQYMPKLSAVANISYIGRLPDDRTRVVSEDRDNFIYRRESVDFFSQSYWNPAISAGVRLTWNIFNGFRTGARVQQRSIALHQAELQYDQAQQQIRMEVQGALRDLEAAQQRILAQEQNVQRAELNYEYARARLAEGIASPVEERNASEQLDQSRLNRLRALYDYLVAQSTLETSMGMTQWNAGEPRLTSK